MQKLFTKGLANVYRKHYHKANEQTKEDEWKA